MQHGNNYKRGHDGSDERGGKVGGRGFGDSGQPTEAKVITNRWRLTLILPTSQNDETSDYIQYRVTIKNGWYKRIFSNEGTTTAGEEAEQRVFQSKEISIKDMERMATTSVMPWRIMKKLVMVDEQNLELAYDGNQKAYSPSAVVGPVVGQEYRVKVKRDCDNGDPDSDRVKDQWYAIIFNKTNTIRCSDVMKQLSGEISNEEITMLFNVVLKSNAILTKGMISLDPSSSAVYFPLHEQRNLLQRNNVPEATKDRTKILLSGLDMNVITQGGMFVQIESSVKYANKEYWQISQEDDRHKVGASRVPLLNVDNRNNAALCGIPIANLHRPISQLLECIEDAIAKLGSVNIIYTSKKNVKPGKDGVIMYKNKPFRKSKREDDSKGYGKRIILSANDLSLHSFTVEDKEFTVASYFDWKFGIKLQYPALPIVYVDGISKHGGGWFPIEFVYQAFNKSKDNSNEIVLNTLKYCDKIAGRKYIDEVQMKLDMLQLKKNERDIFRDRLMRWRVTIEKSPEVETAKVLMPPKISFNNNKSVQVNDGSFNMQKFRFSRPATLTSFAVVNFTNDKKSCYEFIKTEMHILRTHGIEIQSETMKIAENDNLLDLVSEHYQSRDSVDNALQIAAQAVQKVKIIHLHDSQGFYSKNNVFFRTHCFNEQKQRECLVLPPIEKDGPLGLLLNYEDGMKQDQYFSHRVNTNDGREHCVRLMVKIKETDTLIDPLDFRYQNGRHQACRSYGEWQSVNFDEHCYFSPQNGSIYYGGDIRSKRFYQCFTDYEVDFPSIVFVCLPDKKDKAIYDRIKVMSNLLGIQTQCAVMDKFKEQRNKEQYASNIATKVNAKLSTVHNKAISWTSSCDNGSNVDQLPWVGERPSLVVGVGIVHGMFKSVVAASVYLDKGCMRLSQSCFIQKKSDCISVSIISDIMKFAIDNYEIDNKCSPERVLFLRDGISDGNFQQAGIEIEAIRKYLTQRIPGPSIPITFVVCQSQQQGFKMVPNESIRDLRGRPMTNVSSGTSLQCGDNSKSYYLVAQGGLKGTSKPVKHIVIINENEFPVDRSIGLTLPNLMNLTYQMCYKYPTATKAVREVPAIKYAKKLANQVLSSIRFLENGLDWFGRTIRLICPEGDTLTEEDMRPFLKLTIDGTEGKSYNIVLTPFRNHLAA